jgi:hypothetical protein
MKLDKKIIIAIIILPIALTVIYFAYKGVKIVKSIFSFKDAIKLVLSDYGRDIVENAEKITRLESENFISNQWNACFSAGMVATSDVFPYGWSSLEGFWGSEHKPVGIYVSSNKFHYIKFNNVVDGLYTLCQVLQNNGNNTGLWNSLNPSEEIEYNMRLLKIEAKYTNEIQ